MLGCAHGSDELVWPWVVGRVAYVVTYPIVGLPLHINADIRQRQIYNFEYSPSGKDILVFTGRGLHRFPYIVDRDRSSAKRLTSHRRVGSVMSFSSDEKTVVFSAGSLSNTNAHIYSVNRDGSNVRQLTFATSWDWNPHFTSDDDHVVFERSMQNGYDLFIIRLRDGLVYRLTSTCDHAENGTRFSLGRKTIFFARYYEEYHNIGEDLSPGTLWENDEVGPPQYGTRGYYGIYTISAEAPEPKLLCVWMARFRMSMPVVSDDIRESHVISEDPPESLPYARFLAANTNGNTLLFSATESDELASSECPRDLYAFREDTKDLQRLTNLSEQIGEGCYVIKAAKFSPNGKEIVFSVERDVRRYPPKDQLWIINTDGTDLRRIALR